MSKFRSRREQLRRQFRKQDCKAMLVTSCSNVTYLTGFTGDSSYLLLFDGGEVIISDPRYTIQLQEECSGIDIEIRPPGSTLVKSVSRLAAKARISSLAFESEDLSVAQLGRLQAASPKVDWRETSGLVEELREIKDRDEIAAIRGAVSLAERAFALGRAALRGVQTEKEVASTIEHQIRLFGGDGCSFPPIVAVGDRSALAHYRPGDRRVEEGDVVLIDWGATSQLYRSDITRVIITGKPSKKLQRVYEVVLAAQRAAIAKIKPGVLLHDIDLAAREVITDAGFGKRFGHSLGHGIGIDIHEQPRVAKNEQRPIRAGMVVTVEPGIYLPGWGGVRIEDDVLVTRSGNEVLSTVAKEFEDMFQEV